MSTHIVMSCTARKRASAPAGLHLRSLADDVPSVRAREWWGRLKAHEGDRLPAHRLYCGEHWTLARRSLEVLTGAGMQADLWVASAGYGLIPASAPLCSYSATFAEGAPDSVTRGVVTAGARSAVLQAWWACLGERTGPEDGASRSLQALAAKSPNSTLLVVASPNYIQAMRGDLIAARETLKASERLIVISNHSLSSDVELSRNLIPVDERGRSVLGGTMIGLNARVALSLIERGHAGSFTVPGLREKYNELVRDVEKPPKPNRERKDDEDVLAFLRAEFAREPRAGWRRLLGTFRSSGRACGDSRFKELYKQVSEELDASR